MILALSLQFLYAGLITGSGSVLPVGYVLSSYGERHLPFRRRQPIRRKCPSKMGFEFGESC